MNDLVAPAEQLARCRRLLSSVTDQQLRERIEEYARELEAYIRVKPAPMAVEPAK